MDEFARVLFEIGWFRGGEWDSEACASGLTLF